MMESMMVVGLIFVFGSIAAFLISTIHLFVRYMQTGTPISLFCFKICTIYWFIGVVVTLIGWFL